jgi:hypothetical protein
LPNDTRLHGGSNFRFWQIVLKKSFSADERNFSGPLMRSTRGDSAEVVSELLAK